MFQWFKSNSSLTNINYLLTKDLELVEVEFELDPRPLKNAIPKMTIWPAKVRVISALTIDHKLSVQSYKYFFTASSQIFSELVLNIFTNKQESESISWTIKIHTRLVCKFKCWTTSWPWTGSWSWRWSLLIN